MKKFQLHWLGLMFAVSLLSCTSQPELWADYRVIPLPDSIELRTGDPFLIKKSTVICVSQEDERLVTVARLLSRYVAESTGMELQVVYGMRDRNAIRIRTGLENPNPESYSLRVDASGVEIDGATPAGAFYGVQTLRKALPVGEGRILLPAVGIEDAPRFAYRGMHLDVARHMYSVEFVKKYIDLLALHNINMFHWHLTDDQGWRIEIKRYPRLAEVASRRKETLVSHWEKPDHRYDATPYGGYYTQDEIREIVAYAAERQIDVMPEIDLPGHMLAVLAAYPELGCTGGPYEVGTRWGVYEDVLCAGNEKVYEFLENVFSEIVELFPCRYVHIGGDECPKTRWKACPRCQRMIAREGLNRGGHTPEARLQGYLMMRVAGFLEKHGKTVMGWDEILEGGIDRVTIMSWRGENGCIEAAKRGLPAVNTSSTHLYFDYAQSHGEGEPLCVGGDTPVRKVYEYEPLPAELAADSVARSCLLGVQANLWTEYFRDPETVEYMAIPRIDALSEIQWSRPERKDYDDFLVRLQHMRRLYDRLGYNYATHVFETENCEKP